MTAAPAGGILRPRPRYSAAAHDESSKSSSAGPTSGSRLPAAAPAPGASPTPTTRPHSSGRRDVPVPRSLADLVRSATDLNEEARGIISHDGPSSSWSSGGWNEYHPGTDVDDPLATTEGRRGRRLVEKNDPSTLLVVSGEDGTPYLRGSISPDDSAFGGPDASAMMAVGVVGEDGRGVRFCEYDDDVDDVGKKTGDGTASTIRDRIGRRIGVGDDDEDSDDDVDPGKGSDDDEDDGSDGGSDGSARDEEILRELGLSDAFAEDEDGFDVSQDVDHFHPEALRSFRVLWELLARWATPSTVDLVLSYRGQCKIPSRVDQRKHDAEGEESATASPARNDVDIGASRRAGIMSMLKMNVPRSLSELRRARTANARDGVEIIDRKNVEQRLADLVRTFDPAVPAANLSTKMWKGLTTILIVIAFPSEEPATDDGIKLPPSILPLDITAAEYRYLTHSVFTSLSSME